MTHDAGYPCCADYTIMLKALRTIREADRRSAGTTSEDHTEFDGPMGEIATKALIDIGDLT